MRLWMIEENSENGVQEFRADQKATSSTCLRTLHAASISSVKRGECSISLIDPTPSLALHSPSSGSDARACRCPIDDPDTRQPRGTQRTLADASKIVRLGTGVLRIACTVEGLVPVLRRIDVRDASLITVEILSPLLLQELR